MEQGVKCIKSLLIYARPHYQQAALSNLIAAHLKGFFPQILTCVLQLVLPSRSSSSGQRDNCSRSAPEPRRGRT